MQNADAKEIVCRGRMEFVRIGCSSSWCRGRCSWQACRKWVDRDRRRGGDRAALRVLELFLMWGERVAAQVFRVSQRIWRSPVQNCCVKKNMRSVTSARWFQRVSFVAHGKRDVAARHARRGRTFLMIRFSSSAPGKRLCFVGRLSPRCGGAPMTFRGEQHNILITSSKPPGRGFQIHGTEARRACGGSRHCTKLWTTTTVHWIRRLPLFSDSLPFEPWV